MPESRLLIYAILGYMSGSVLYARVFAHIMGKDDCFRESADQNPGTENAFRFGGFMCGALTLLCDVAKGYIPVSRCMRDVGIIYAQSWMIALAIAAPVAGHIFPVFYHMRGGKGIAVTFGCMLGLMPDWRPLAILACVFIMLSTVLRITPNYHRTLAAYPLTCAGMLLFRVRPCICIGFLIIAAMVWLRLIASREQKEEMRVRFLWMH